MNKKLLLPLVPLLLLGIFLGIPSVVLPAHAAGTVCFNDPSSFSISAPCAPAGTALNGPAPSATLTNPIPAGAVRGPNQIRVGVYLSGPDLINGFDITVLAARTVLRPTGVDLSGTILATPTSIVVECLDGALVTGPTCLPSDVPGTIHFSVSGGPGVLSTASTGLLFTAIYNITARSTATVPISFQTGCGSPTSPTSHPPICVTMTNGGSGPVSESVGTIGFNNSVDPNWVAISTATPTVAFNFGSASPLAKIDATAEGGWPGIVGADSISFTSLQPAGLTVSFTGAVTSCATGVPTTTTCEISASFNGSPGSYSVTFLGNYVYSNDTTLAPDGTLAGTVTVVVNIGDVSWTVNGLSEYPTTTAQNAYMGTKTPGAFLFTVQSLGGYTGTITYSTRAIVAGGTGFIVPTTGYPAPFTLGAGQTITKIINGTATANGKATYIPQVLVTGFATAHASGSISVFVSGFTLSSNSTSVTFAPGGSKHVQLTTASLGNPPATNGFAGSVALTAPYTGPAGGVLVFTFTPASSITLTAGGTGSVNVGISGTTAGTYSVTFTGTGGTNNDMTNSTAVTVTVTGVANPTSTSLTCSSPVVDNQASSCTATVTQTSGTLSFPTGTVNFTTNSTGTFSASSCTLSSTATPGVSNCTFTYTPTVLGHHLLTATYAGDSSHNGSSGTFTLAVNHRTTTTIIACSPASVPDNTATSCTATVADSSGAGGITPTGTVTFTTNSTGTFTSTTCTLSAGSCGVSYTPTVSGHHLITGSYAGDSSHSSSQGTFTIAVTPAPPHATTTAVSCTPSSVTVNTASSCLATVADTSSSPTTPTGTVHFTTNSTGTFSPTSASCTLTAGTTAGTASCSVSYTPTVVGHHLITGAYSGDATHATSTGTFTLAVTPQPLHTTTTSVSCSPSSVIVNTASSCAATVTDTSATPTTPTGTLTFTTNSTGTFSPATSCTLAAGATAGTASCSVSYTPTVAGHALITGSYGGDSTHTSSQGTFTLASTPAPLHNTTTNVVCSPASVTSGTATSCTATVTDTSSSPTTPTGTISFTTNSTGTFSPSATCNLTAGTSAGTASCSASYTPTVIGHHLITGSYNGDSTHNKSSGTFTLAVGSVPLHTTATSVQCSPSSVTVSTASSCTATVTDSSATPTTPTGSVGFATNSTGTFAPTTASCTLAAGATAGTASCSLSYTPTVIGHHLITGSYGGDSTHSSSQGTFVLAATSTPPHATTTSVTCSPSSVNVGTSSSCTATVTDTSASPTTPTGSVAFTTNSTGTFTPTAASCTLAAGTAGTASCFISYTPSVTGHHMITSTYGGDSTHTASQGSFLLTASPAPLHNTTTNVVCSPASVTSGTATSCTATVTDSSSSPTTPTGTVSFTTNSTGTFTPTTATCSLTAGTAAGTASCSLTYTPGVTGHHLITGSYNGDSTHNKSSGTFTLAVGSVPLHGTNTSVQCTPSSVTVNTAASCTATVTDTSSSPTTPTGTVTFTSNSTGTFAPAATCTLVAGATAGTASCSVSYTPTVIGHHVITGSYGGDSTHTASSGSFTIAATSVPLHTTTTSVQCSPVSVTVGSATSCTATVTDSSSSPTTPTGSVSFTTNSTGTFAPTSASCTLAAGSTGTASCSVSYTPTVAGHHLITGSYTGDSSHSFSTGTFVLAATPAPAHATTTSVACASSSVNVGTSTTCTATVTDTSSSPSTPTGTVGFTTNSTGTFGSTTCTLAGTTTGTASCTVSYTPTVVGHHLITGTYGGDATHSASQGTFTLAATPAPIHSTTTSVTCSPSSVIVNTASTCTARLTDTSASPTSPTGSMTFTTNSTGTFSPSPASCALVAGATTGTAQCSISYTPTVTGHHLITGSYSGDTSHTSSSGSFNLASTPVTTTVHPTQTNITCSPGSVTVNVATSCTARVIDTSSTPTIPIGTVAFTTNSTGSFSPSATCTLVAGNGPNMATCSVSYTPTVTGKHMITGAYSGDSSHQASSGSFTVNVRSSQGGHVLLSFTGFDVDDFDNGVGQLNVLINGQLMVDIPVGLNHLTGTGDFRSYENAVVNFGPFDITSFIVQGQNTLLFKDPTTFDHFGIVSNIVITQDGSVLLNAPRARGVYPAFSFSYTFSNPPLVLNNFTGSSLSPVIGQTVTFTATYTGGTAPFRCVFQFGDGGSAVVAGVNGVCTAIHHYYSSSSFTVRVTIIGSSTSDRATSSLSITVAGGRDP